MASLHAIRSIQGLYPKWFSADGLHLPLNSVTWNQLYEVTSGSSILKTGPMGIGPIFDPYDPTTENLKPVQQLFEKSQLKKILLSCFPTEKKPAFISLPVPDADRMTAAPLPFMWKVQDPRHSRIRTCVAYTHINLITFIDIPSRERSIYIPDKQPALVSGWFSELPRLVGYVIVSWRVHGTHVTCENRPKFKEFPRFHLLRIQVSQQGCLRLSETLEIVHYSCGASRKTSMYHFFTLGTDWCGSYK